VVVWPECFCLPCLSHGPLQRSFLSEYFKFETIYHVKIQVVLNILLFYFQSTLCGGIASILVTFWISMGKNFSKTLRRQPWLQMPPIDNCVSVMGNNSLPVTVDPLNNLITTQTLHPNTSNIAVTPTDEYIPYVRLSIPKYSHFRTDTWWEIIRQYLMVLNFYRWTGLIGLRNCVLYYISEDVFFPRVEDILDKCDTLYCIESYFLSRYEHKHS
jgi:hypothetical protein